MFLSDLVNYQAVKRLVLALETSQLEKLQSNELT